ncbi:hypothetical protein EMCRGX_G016740 [Ephydatia muelleri]
MSSSLQLFLLPLLVVANAYRLGAPIESCASIYPVGHNAIVHNSTATPNVDLNISGFTNGSYIPGKVYTRRLKADEKTPVGQFLIANGVRLMDCHMLPNSTVTHTNNTAMRNTTLNWTAPNAGAGPVVFLFAVVVEYSRRKSQNIFYATLKTSSIMELGADAPQQGNGTSQLTNATSLYMWPNGTSETRNNGTSMNDATNGASFPLLHPATTTISLLCAMTLFFYFCV